MYDTETKLVTPDTRRGLLFLERQDDDLLHLKWKTRNASGAVEDDLIIFPDDAELKLIPGKRVYVLAFKSSSARLFFWIQESLESADAERLAKFNKTMNESGDAFGLDSMVSETSGQLEQLGQILSAFKVSDGGTYML